MPELDSKTQRVLSFVFAKRGWQAATWAHVVGNFLVVRVQQPAPSEAVSTALVRFHDVLGKKTAVAIRDWALAKKKRHVVISVPGSTSHASQVFQNLPLLKAEILQDADLLFDRTRSRLVPRYWLLTEQDTKALEEERKLERLQLPHLLASDPVARIFGFSPGQVVRNEETHEFRVVV